MATTRGRKRPDTRGFITRRLSLLGLVLSCVVLLIIGRNATTIVQTVRQHLTDLSAPVLELATGPVAQMRQIGSQIGSYQYLSGEVGRLREENEALQGWKAKALELEGRLRSYEELLNARREPEMNFVTARVIADARGPFVRTLIVNAGSVHGVRQHQAVMDGRGLVGRTLTAGRKASRVLLLSDLNSRVPVRIEPTGYRAILTGTNRAEPRLEFLPAQVSLHEGDIVFTSGDGGLLPPGLPIGVVAADEAGAFKVVPYANPRRLSYVRILDYEPSLKIDTQAEALVDKPAAKVVETAEGAPVAADEVSIDPAATTGVVEPVGAEQQ